jgi:dynactin complex subunit
MKGVAECIKDKERCKLMTNGCRGTVMYVGKVPGMGFGYYVGIILDGPYGDNNGIYKSTKYF